MPFISNNQANSKNNQHSTDILTKLYALNKPEVLHESGDEVEMEYEESESEDSGQEYTLATHKRRNIQSNHLNDDSIDVSNLISQYRLANSFKDPISTTNISSISSPSPLPNAVITTNASSKSKSKNSELKHIL